VVNGASVVEARQLPAVPAPQGGLSAAPVRRTETLWFHLAAAALALVVLISLTSCRLDMQVQPRVDPLAQSDFYEDQRGARPLIEGTVARGDLRTDPYFYTGYIGKETGNYLPFPATQPVLERGRERYNIYCAPCHSRTGDGNGMIVQRGYRRPPSYHIERLRNAPLGHFFDVITNGFGAMPDYASQIPVADRWAIIAYIRALQLSQNAPQSLVPAGQPIPSVAPPTTGTPGSGATPVQAAPSSGDLPASNEPGAAGKGARQEQRKLEQQERKLEKKVENK
jgi:mono/diheme cytochrome c family protein